MAWLDGTLGHALMDEERALVGAILTELPLFRDSLGIAPQSYATFLNTVAERSRHSHVLAPAAGNGLGGEPGATRRPPSLVWGLPEALPFASAQLDLVVLVHTLEFSRSPYRVVAEAERVLAPGGRLLVLTFNPVSLFGLARPWLRRAARYGPWSGRFLRAIHVRSMLESTDLAPERSRYVFFRPPLTRERALRATRFLERVPGRHRLPWGAVSCIQARKEEPGVTLLGPAYRAELAGRREPGIPAYPFERHDQQGKGPGPHEPIGNGGAIHRRCLSR
ncbi:methyltransferase domain-containing protein [Thiohalorhabdus sp.]|uniref:methyltransferase domain-containing protein n=1 Tax=Thiohalorhabdus sp. TaxID=3094134 RepID=UPI002FC3A76D